MPSFFPFAYDGGPAYDVGDNWLRGGVADRPALQRFLKGLAIFDRFSGNPFGRRLVIWDWLPTSPPIHTAAVQVFLSCILRLSAYHFSPYPCRCLAVWLSGFLAFWLTDPEATPRPLVL